MLRGAGTARSSSRCTTGWRSTCARLARSSSPRWMAPPTSTLAPRSHLLFHTHTHDEERERVTDSSRSVHIRRLMARGHQFRRSVARGSRRGQKKKKVKIKPLSLFFLSRPARRLRGRDRRGRRRTGKSVGEKTTVGEKGKEEDKLFFY